ncbi:hypothetical protein F4781DRAFT_433713 [Annulohypoxylon bovei var. microspora]|nr:hypothetical protein F4781DRAFT_433713 [Annulohypoxylon bovei var. microspora]
MAENTPPGGNKRKSPSKKGSPAKRSKTRNDDAYLVEPSSDSDSDYKDLDPRYWTIDSNRKRKDEYFLDLDSDSDADYKDLDPRYWTIDPNRKGEAQDELFERCTADEYFLDPSSDSNSDYEDLDPNRKREHRRGRSRTKKPRYSRPPANAINFPEDAAESSQGSNHLDSDGLVPGLTSSAPSVMSSKRSSGGNAVSCPALSPPRYSADPVSNAEPQQPPTFNDWWIQLKPNAPTESVTIPRKWEDIHRELSSEDSYAEDLDDMSSQAPSRSMVKSRREIGPLPGSSAYLLLCNINGIKLVDYSMSTPKWIVQLFETVSIPPPYVDPEAFIENRGQYLCQYMETTWELQVQPFFPLYDTTYSSFYKTVMKHKLHDDFYLRTSGKVGRRGENDNLTTHLKLFPQPEGLKSTRPDILIGYSLSWLSAVLDNDDELASKIYATCQITTEGAIFPYLFVELKSGSGDTLTVATHQLLTSCAAALAITKDLFPHRNAVFGLAMDSRSGILLMMWIDQPQPGKQPRYLMKEMAQYNLASAASVINLQDVLMNIHAWGHGTRRTVVKEQLREQLPDVLEKGIDEYIFGEAAANTPIV